MFRCICSLILVVSVACAVASLRCVLRLRDIISLPFHPLLSAFVLMVDGLIHLRCTIAVHQFASISCDRILCLLSAYSLAVDEASVEELIDEGCVEVLMQMMMMNPNNEKAGCLFVFFLWSLAVLLIRGRFEMCRASDNELLRALARTMGPLNLTAFFDLVSVAI